MKLVVGLGNPGRVYEQTRHNIGFKVVEALARRQGLTLRKRFFFPARQARYRVGDETVLLLEPTTYMNRSGRAVWGTMRRWRIAPAEVVVIYDDVELALGEVRVRGRGTGGSHNGMRSVAEWLETGAFPRVRVGVGPKPEGDDLIRFVLGPFGEEESLKLEKVVEQAADAVESLFSKGIEQTMNAFNRPKDKQGERH